MESFRPWRGGYLAKADSTERKFFAGLASDVAFMLGHPLDRMLQDARREPDESDPLAAYEAEFAGIDGEDGQAADEFGRPMDEAFHRLLPDMSEDPEQARTLREMTQDSLASVKSEQLLVFYRSVTASTDHVWVGNEDMPAWISAVNSIRLVCSARLEITDGESAEDVYRRAQALTGISDGGEGREIDNTEDLLAVLYSMLTWWQESLLAAVRNKQLRG